MPDNANFNARAQDDTGLDPATARAPNPLAELSGVEKAAGISAEQYRAPYELDWESSYLTYDSGKRQAAVAGDPDATDPKVKLANQARILIVHAGTTQRVIEFHKIRVADTPDVPSPLPANVNEVLRSAEIRVDSVRIDPDGETRRYEVKGRYVFLLRDPDWYLKKGVQFPVVPSTTAKLSEAVLAVAKFKAGTF